MAGILTSAAGPWPRSALYNYRSGVQLQDDFITGSTTSGTVGALGWGTGGTITSMTSTAANPGQIQLDTSAVSGTISRLNGFGSFPVWMANAIDLTWILKVGTNDANTTIRAGLTNNWAGNPATDGIYFEKADADTNWFAVTRASSTETPRSDTGVAVGTSAFVAFRIVRSTSSATFYINGARVATKTTNLPAVAGGPGVMIINSAAAAKTIIADYFEITISGLSR